MAIASGIDFGTSNSSISYIKDGKIRLIPLEGDNVTMPTALFFNEDGSDTSYGTEAVKSFTKGEYGRFMRSIKRILGSSTMDTGTLINGRQVKFNYIIGEFIRHLKKRLEEDAGCCVDAVVMGRPVRFRNNSDEEDRKAEQQLKLITEKAGFRTIGFQFEPIAAAFAHERRIEHEALACVVDIGGGTSDFTIIKIGKGLRDKIDRSSDILANTGIRVGGNDFDKSLSIYGFMPALGRGTSYGDKNQSAPYHIYSKLSEWSEINFAYTPDTLRTVKKILRESHDPEKYARLLALIEQEKAHELLQVVEQTKIDLTYRTEVVKKLNCVKDTPSVAVTQQSFNDYIAENIGKIQISLQECLMQAQVVSENVELVILTGGSTEIPLVKNTAMNVFPKAKFSEENKLSSVGEGLAYDSHRRFGTD